MADIQSIAKLLSAGGHETRLRILHRLEERATSGQELADLLGLRRQTLQKHLQTLSDAGLITFDPSMRRYRLHDSDAARRLLGVAPEIFPPPPRLPSDV